MMVYGTNENHTWYMAFEIPTKRRTYWVKSAYNCMADILTKKCPKQQITITEIL